MSISENTPKEYRDTTPPLLERAGLGRLGLGVKLPLIAILLLIAAFFISSILSTRAAEAALTSTLEQELISQSISQAELIRSNLLSSRNVAIDLAAASEVGEYDQNGLLSLIRNTLRRNGQIFGSTIAYEPYQFQENIFYWSPYYNRGESDSLRFTQLGNPEYDYFSKEWYLLPKQTLEPVLSPPYFDEGGGDIWMVTWSIPFFDLTSGEIKGVATADIAFSQTQEIVSSINVGQNGYAFLLDPQGTLLGVGFKGGSYNAMEDSMLTIAKNSGSESWIELTSSMLQGGTDFVTATDPRGIPMYVAYTPIGLGTEWTLAVAYPQSELFQNSANLQRTLFSYAALVMVAAALVLYFYTLTITRPIQRLTQFANKFNPEQLLQTEGNFADQVQIKTRDEIEDLANAFNRMTTELSRSFMTLEERVNERTAALDKRATRLKIIADVGKVITSFRDLSELLKQTTILIHENFGYYHAGIFLIDERGEVAILAAANSPGGQRMLNKEHKLKIGGMSIVGYAIEHAEARIALDVGRDAVYFDNPELPDTRSEMALPLIVGGQNLGALDVQSTEPRAFGDEDISTLQVLADQIAIAIRNANLFEENKKAMQNASNIYGEISRDAWGQTLKNQSRVGFIATPPTTIQTFGEVTEEGMSKAFTTGDVISDSDGLTINVPIKIRGQSIGTIRLKKSDISEAWTQEETSLAISLSDQLSGALESARLFRESQQRATRETMVSDISARLSSVSQVEAILRETVNELGQALGNASISFQLVNQAEVQSQGPDIVTENGTSDNNGQADE